MKFSEEQIEWIRVVLGGPEKHKTIISPIFIGQVIAELTRPQHEFREGEVVYIEGDIYPYKAIDISVSAWLENDRAGPARPLTHDELPTWAQKKIAAGEELYAVAAALYTAIDEDDCPATPWVQRFYGELRDTLNAYDEATGDE